jgi:streptomycin 3"-adenylyltransferase
MSGHPVYALLNTCRVLWYLGEECICSKDEAGTWAVETLPGAFRDMLRQALAIYRGERDDAPFSEEMLCRFAAYATEQIRASTEL